MLRVPHRRRPLVRAARAGCLGLLVWLQACTLLVGADALEEGCPSGQKACDGRCVSRADPDFGCDSDDCRPCVIAQATARCSSEGACVVASCQGDFADCNGDGDRSPSDGCEIDTAHDPEHCGSCDADACRTEHGMPACAGGTCSIRLCESGYRDCNFDVVDGCETPVSRGQACP